MIKVKGFSFTEGLAIHRMARKAHFLMDGMLTLDFTVEKVTVAEMGNPNVMAFYAFDRNTVYLRDCLKGNDLKILLYHELRHVYQHQYDLFTIDTKENIALLGEIPYLYKYTEVDANIFALYAFHGKAKGLGLPEIDLVSDQTGIEERLNFASYYRDLALGITTFA